jgi:hypothetical protein
MFSRREGGFSIIRMGTIAAVIGILVIVGGVVSFFIDRASHQVPLDIEPFPGAASFGTRDTSSYSRSVFFQIKGKTPEEVMAYYQRKLNEFTGDKNDKCVRAPLVGNFLEFDQGKEGVVPFQFSCMFDRSGFQVSQYTRVNIQPGIKANKTEGATIVEHEQYWQR